ncbi:MAG: hypothetical protein ACRCXT_18005 [Paraclostridium sp.]
MIKGYIVDVIKDYIDSVYSEDIIVNIPKVDDELLEFSTDISEVQEECFNIGIMGNCNKDCKMYGNEYCMYTEV